jgi:methyltransferase family protein
MNRHDFLSGIHAAYQPRNYLEIGINDGRGLRRSRTRTIGVDPAFKITSELECDLQLVKATSDDFFAREHPIARFPEGVVDLTFIDGLHIFEFALRDFMNAERLSAPTSVIIFDDMLPRTVDEAARDRHTLEWTGDVFKVATVLERYRSDLVLVGLDTVPTGLLLVAGTDPTNTVLQDNYEAILAEFVGPDPQAVPEQILHRSAAADPQAVLDSPVWADLVAARAGRTGRPDTIDLLRELRGTASYVSNPPPAKPWPPVKTQSPSTATARKSALGAQRGLARAKTLARRVRKAVKRRP